MKIEGITLRQAAIITGLAYLLNPTAYAENLYHKLVIAGHVDQTIANIGAHSGLFSTVILFYLVNFVGDIVIAWALYVLLAPVNRALSLLASWFQLVYAAAGFSAALNLTTVSRLILDPNYPAVLQGAQLQAQVATLLDSFRYGWSFSLILFGIHLILVGWLIVRSRYIPWIIGVIIGIDGIGWLITELQPYLFPSVNVDWLFFTFFGELIFMVWLLIFGWRIKEPASQPA